jgi:hypothetical protein
MGYIWAFVFMLGGVVGDQLAAWLRHRWLARHRPTMSIEEATDRIMAELAEERHVAEEAMGRIEPNDK